MPSILRQVTEQLAYQGKSVPELVAILDPLLREHGYTINQIIGDTAAYTTTGVVADRSFDIATVTLAELGHVVGTLIADLKAKGVLS